MQPSLIIFDCDGVLLETESIANQCEVDALRQLGHAISLDEYLNIALGRCYPEVHQTLQKERKIDVPLQFWQDVEERQKDLFKQHLKPVAGVAEILQWLSLPKCVASNSGRERLHRTLDLTGILPYFGSSVFSADLVENRKPAPDIFLYAAQRMGACPSECVVIEDSLTGITAALAANMTVFAFGGAKHITEAMKQKLLASGAHRYFENMAELKEILPC